MASPKQIDALEKKRLRLQQSLAALGPTLQGSILRRIIRREDPAHPGAMKDYGPYFQWTRKRSGRTVIQNLSASQAREWEKAIEENRKLENILEKMRELSLAILELTTEGVVKRKMRKRSE